MKDMAIDEVRQDKLDWLKVLADEYFEVNYLSTILNVRCSGAHCSGDLVCQ